MAIEKIRIPDFGDVQEITVVEVFIKPGDQINKEASLLTLESEKAVMDIPSPFSGIIKEVLVKEENTVASGDVIAVIETDQASASEQSAEKPEEKTEESESTKQAVAVEEKESSEASEKETESKPEQDQSEKQLYHATPSVRALAREQQIDLARSSQRDPGAAF